MPTSIPLPIEQPPPGAGGVAQRLALQEMTESEERFRQLVESMSDVFWIYEPQDTRFLYVSPAYEREWMRSAKALYADPHEWLSAVHSTDRQLLQDAFDHLASGDSYALEYRVTTTSGEERWIAERAFPVASQSGQMSRIAGVSQDVIARKKADLELFRADRRKGEFLAMLAHELRSPLEPIRSAAILLARQHVDGPVIEQKAISVIERHVDYLTRLVDDLPDVARTDHGKIRLRSKVVPLGGAIDAAIDANRTLANGDQQQDGVARWT
jgi:PAS domain S-box-containing protein